MLVANFKSHKTTHDVLSWLKVVGQALAKDPKNIDEIVICPQDTALETIQSLLNASGWRDTIKLGSQDISAFNEGAYTGEVAAQTLKGVIDYTIIGHSERRQLFGEKADLLLKKYHEAIDNTITPIYCVTEETVAEVEALSDHHIIVAFEPPAAIGSGKPADCATISRVINQLYDLTKGQAHLLYGGSVSAAYVPELLAIKHVQGFLVGTASLDEQAFLELVYAVRQFRQTRPTANG